MSWSKLAPIVKSTGRPMASASLVVNKDGAPKVSLIFSASLKDDYKAFDRVDVSAGEGEHIGCLLLEFGAGGAFEIKNFVHGGARIFVPLGPGVPDKPAANQPCKILAFSADSLVVELPVEAWRRDIQSRTASKRLPAAQEDSASTAPPRTGVGNGRPLDAVEYLRGKGLSVERLAGGRFQVDGEVLQHGQVVKLVNDHRLKADLDPLPATKIA